MIEGAPLPAVSDDSAPFWEGCAAGELRMQACASCGRLRFPPRPVCPWCQSFEHEWKVMSGRATVWSYVVSHPPLLPAFEPLAPYNVVVVTLDEDPTIRMVGNLVDGADGAINSIDPASIRIGEPVTVVFQHGGEDITFPRWVRAAP